MSELKVGDKVYGYLWGKIEVRKIKTVTKKTVTFEGGSYPSRAGLDLRTSWCNYFTTPDEAVSATIERQHQVIEGAKQGIEKAKEVLAKFKEAPDA